MHRAVRSALGVMVLGIALGTLTACTVASGTENAPSAAATPRPETTASFAPTPNSTDEVPRDERAQQYSDAVATFPLAFPNGDTFPDEVPAKDWNNLQSEGIANGKAVAYAWWRCSVAEAARDSEVLAGDYATSRSLLSQIRAISDDDLPGNTAWVHNVIDTAYPDIFNSALEGESGFCFSWRETVGPDS